MTIDEYRVSLGWTKTKLCEEADIDMSTLQRAISGGKKIYRITAVKIADAMNRELEKRGKPTVRYTDFEGVQFFD